MNALAGKAPGTVILNPLSQPIAKISRHTDVPNDDRLKIVSLCHYSWNRGVDRIIELAAEISRAGYRSRVLFILAGDMDLKGRLPDRLDRFRRRGGSLQDVVDAESLSDMFLFLGPVTEPERVLLAGDALINLTREKKPWGRDIIEALYLQRPVFTIGTWDRFVKNGETGILVPEFDTRSLASQIIELCDDRDHCRAMGIAGNKLIAELCNSADRAADLVEVWRRAANSPSQRTH